MSDGEDYELCFTAAGEVPDRIADVEITAVGRIVPHNDPQDSPVVVRNGAESFDAAQLVPPDRLEFIGAGKSIGIKVGQATRRIR